VKLFLELNMDVTNEILHESDNSEKIISLLKQEVNCLMRTIEHFISKGKYKIIFFTDVI